MTNPNHGPDRTFHVPDGTFRLTMGTDPGRVDSQQGVADAVAWYAPALGVGDWSFVCQWNAPTEYDTQAEVHRDPCHRTAVVSVNNFVRHVDHGRWAAFHDPENSVVHELIHVVMQDYESAVQRLMDAVPEGDVLDHLRAEVDRHHERCISVLARAITTVAHADRTGPPPTVGGIVHP